MKDKETREIIAYIIGYLEVKNPQFTELPLSERVEIILKSIKKYKNGKVP